MQLSPEQLERLEKLRPSTASRWADPRRHLEAYAVIDHGARPALGSVQRVAGVDELEALDYACRAARSASIRLGLLGLPRGGAGIVIMDAPQLDRASVSALLRERLPSWPGRMLADARVEALEGVAEIDALVRRRERVTALRGRVLDAVLEPVLAHVDDGVQRSALVLGANAIGRDAATSLRARGWRVSLWDAQADAAEAMASALPEVQACAGPWTDAEALLVVPCTDGLVSDQARAAPMRASWVLGLVPRPFAGAAVIEALEARGIGVVPPVLSAQAEMIALVEAEGLMDADAALAVVEGAAREVLVERVGASDRALTLAIERAKAAGGG